MHSIRQWITAYVSLFNLSFVYIKCFFRNIHLFNIVDLPAAILQQPFFDAKRPSFVNYANIGQFIGHEITHGFDDFGRSFNRFGGFTNWWRNDTNEKYKAKSKCFEEQFSAYETAAGDKVSKVMVHRTYFFLFKLKSTIQ